MKTIRSIAGLALLTATLSFAVLGCKTAGHDHSSASASAEKCVVSGEPLGAHPYTFVHNGQPIKLCCEDCLATFNKDPQKYLAKLNSAK